LLVYRADSLSVGRFVTIDEKNQYFQMIRSTWGQQLKSVFESIPDPIWNAAPDATSNVLSTSDHLNQPVRISPPASIARTETQTAQRQTLAQDNSSKHQY
jgi:putative proteasome-type protease